MLLQNYFQKYAKAYSESCEASKVELKQKQLTDFSRELFSQKVPSQMFQNILNTPLIWKSLGKY